MKKLVLLAAIFALCVPGYGAVLVYKLAHIANPVIDFADANEKIANVTKTTVEAYVVFDVNVIGDANGMGTYDVNTADVNNSPASIVLFKKDKQYMLLGGSDANSSVDISGTKPFTVFKKKNTLSTLMSVEISDRDTGLDIYVFDMFGKNISTNITTANKALVAKSLGGIAEITISEDGDLLGFGLAKLTLNSKYTRLAGRNGLNVEQTIAAIKGALKKFSETQIVPR